MSEAEEILGWRLTRWRAWVIVVAVWGLVYLPGLGELELRGNEAKRILPALHMLEGGSWVTPQLAGEKYFNKPPLMYWMIAAAFWVTGTRAEWAARIPSVLAVLSFATLLIWRGRAWLTLRGRLCAALIFMTVVSFIEKGRSSEIEASFVSVTGWAVWWWLSGWARYREQALRAHGRRARLRLWLPVGVIIGLGLLLKGPLLLVFVYVPIVAVLMYERRLRELWSWEHVAAVFVWASMLLGWVAACQLENPGASAVAVWQEEMGSRFVPDEVTFVSWARNVGKVFIDFLPWAVFLPLLWWGVDEGSREEDRRVFRGLRLALVICFVVVNMLPGTRPRYSMPLFGTASILLGWTMSRRGEGGPLVAWWVRLIRLAGVVWVCGVCGALVLGPSGVMSKLLRLADAPFAVPPPADAQGWMIAAVSGGVIASVAVWIWKHAGRIRSLADCVVVTSGFMATGVLAFAVYLMPFFTCNAIRRQAGAAVTGAVPAAATLHVFARPDLRESGYQPFLYYVPRRLVFITNIIDVSRAPFVLTPSHHTNDWLARSEPVARPRTIVTNFIFKDDAFAVLGPGE